MRAFILALALVSAGALVDAAGAQSRPPPPPRPNGLVFHVAVAGTAATPVVSLGMAQPAAAGALIRQRREMRDDCTWSQATDLTAPADQLVPLRDPNDLGGAEQFGDYYAQLFAALVTAKGGAANAGQYACVRRTMTTLAASLLQRRAEAHASPPQRPASAPGQPARPGMNPDQ